MSSGNLNDDSQGRPVPGGDVDDGVYRSQYDLRERSASEAIVSAVSAATETDPLALPPLYDTVDPDALDGVFSRSSKQGTRGNGGTPERSVTKISFTYAGSRVQVTERGLVSVDLH